MRTCPFLIKEALRAGSAKAYGLDGSWDKEDISKADNTYCRSFCQGLGCKYFENNKCQVSKEIENLKEKKINEKE